MSKLKAEHILGAILQEDSELIKQIIDFDPRIVTYKTDANSLNALHLCVEGATTEIFEQIIAAGAKLPERTKVDETSFFWARTETGQTALIMATDFGLWDRANLILDTYEKVLIEHDHLPKDQVKAKMKEFVNIPDNEGRIALHKPDLPPELAKRLLALGSDPRALDHEGNTPGHIWAGDKTSAKTMINGHYGHKLDSGSVLYAPGLKLLTDHGLDPYARNSKGETIIDLVRINTNFRESYDNHIALGRAQGIDLTGMEPMWCTDADIKILTDSYAAWKKAHPKSHLQRVEDSRTQASKSGGCAIM